MKRNSYFILLRSLIDGFDKIPEEVKTNKPFIRFLLFCSRLSCKFGYRLFLETASNGMCISLGALGLGVITGKYQISVDSVITFMWNSNFPNERPSLRYPTEECKIITTTAISTKHLMKIFESIGFLFKVLDSLEEDGWTIDSDPPDLVIHKGGTPAVTLSVDNCLGLTLIPCSSRVEVPKKVKRWKEVEFYPPGIIRVCAFATPQERLLNILRRLLGFYILSEEL